MNLMKIPAGQRFRLEDETQFAKIISGKIEVYAVTKGDASFRQFFLMSLEKNEIAFPAMDEFKKIDVQIYAVEDSEICLIPFTEVSTENIKLQMKNWFGKLIELSWLKLLADRGDEELLTWRHKTVLDNAETLQELLTEFKNNEQIFAMFLGVHFGAEDNKLNKRVQIRTRSKKYLIENGIRSLLGEEKLNYSGGDELSKNKFVKSGAFVVRLVAKALNMPTDKIFLDSEVAGRMDQVTLLRRLMQKGNMQMRLVTLDGDWYKKDTSIFIGYYGEKKDLAAILPTSPETYKVFTESFPNGLEVDDDTVKNLAKDAFQCYAGFPARELKIFDLLKFMFQQCWKADYRTVIITSLFAGLIPLATPIITETIFQDIIPILDRQGLATVTQALMVTSFTTAALSIVRSIAVMRISTRIEMSAEAALWGRLMSLPTKFFRRYTVGELASRMGGLGVVKGLVSGEFVGAVMGFIFSFWSIFLMCYYSMKLTAAAIAVWLIYSIFIAFIYRRVLNYQRKIIAAGNKTAGTVQQIFAGLSKFRVQGAEEQAYNLWSRDFGEQWNWSLKLRWQNNYTSIIGSIQPFILTMLLYYIAVYGVNETLPNGQTVQGITYAQFLAFNAAYSSFNGTLGGIIGFIGQYFAIQPELENFRPILKETPESVGEKSDAGILSGSFEVRHLSFAYENGPEVLHDINFSVSAGENVAIVGKSGSGKSTLVRLLLGFEQAKAGAIYFDGQDLTDLNLPSVRTQMGVVLQNGQLMTGDIFTNIVGTRLLTQEDAWEAAEQAGIAEDIAMMPMGMQTVISEGSSNISGGQRQRLLIARALVNKPSILIFDEATSALDNRSQSIVTRSLEKLKATRIIVAHRLSTIRGCDRIIVMEDGKIAETGKFDELVARGGIFAGLVKRQSI